MDVGLVNKIIGFLSMICAMALFIAILPLPIGYYEFLRLLVFVGGILVILKNIGLNHHWVMVFAAISILFNPIYPIYLNSKLIWIPIDIATGILFVLETFQKRLTDISSGQSDNNVNPKGRGNPDGDNNEIACEELVN
jgi:hypothetical protein